MVFIHLDDDSLGFRGIKSPGKKTLDYMNNTRRLVCLAIAAMVGIGMCRCALAQSGGAYAAGINYPAGPPNDTE